MGPTLPGQVCETIIEYKVTVLDPLELPLEDRSLLWCLGKMPKQSERGLANFCKWSRSKLRRRLHRLRRLGFLTWVVRPRSKHTYLVSKRDQTGIETRPDSIAVSNRSKNTYCPADAGRGVSMRDPGSDDLDGTEDGPKRRVAPSTPGYEAWSRRWTHASGMPWSPSIQDALEIRRNLIEAEKKHTDVQVDYAMKKFFLDSYAAKSGYPHRLFFRQIQKYMADEFSHGR